ncbi:DUF4190 domain-containing protein [Actinomadura sp. NPDC048955]|uniref:DUF4190 domain-containing protein n=1 Tax=Actinomadura luteofluorescens TaxID=46163 RepID=A0A7Y9EIT4_9ACTN|nr:MULTISPECIES: DUF4190 domain-containing protein [Actinomadura]MCR3739760.1 protein of unknown function (DUF4190) [Actinomadura glauciflava]NYD48316.1 hypothetical protein [Actinomadura luteofluorescens]
MAQPPYDPYGYGAQDPYAQSYSQPPAVQQHHYYGQPMPAMRPTNGMATASLVCGLIGFFACGVTSILAVIFGHVSLGQIKRTGEGGHGMAVTGLILGYLISAGWLLILLFYILGIAMFAASSGSTSTY